MLLPVSWLYVAGVWLRNMLFDSGWLNTASVQVPVISVGNITTGGTGKTPFVEYLVRYCLDHGRKVSVISRGYKRRTQGTVVVSDGSSVKADVYSSGDEPYQIATRFPGAVVVVDERRARGAEVAVHHHHADAVILDDGFQHRSLHRDLDIVLVDDSVSLGSMAILPAGHLREPLSSLQRADLVVVTRSMQSGNAESVLRGFDGPIVRTRMRSTGCYSLLNGQQYSGRNLGTLKGIALCGIGNPHSFEAMLLEQDIHSSTMMNFPDHHHYSESDVRDIRREFETLNADFVVTTEKDAVRLSPLLRGGSFEPHQFLYLAIELFVVDGESTLHHLIDSTLNGRWQ